MPGERTVDAIFNVKWMLEEYQKKLCACFADMEKAFDRFPRKGDGVGHEKEGFIRNNGSSSSELVRRSKHKSEGRICVFKRLK